MRWRPLAFMQGKKRVASMDPRWVKAQQAAASMGRKGMGTPVRPPLNRSSAPRGRHFRGRHFLFPWFTRPTG